MEVANARWIVTKWDGDKCVILKSVSVGGGGWHMRAEWIDMDDAGEYPTAFFTSLEGDARTIAGLVGGCAVKVAAGLVGVNE